MTAVCLQLAPLLEFITRWSKDFDIVFITLQFLKLLLIRISRSEEIITKNMVEIQIVRLEIARIWHLRHEKPKLQ